MEQLTAEEFISKITEDELDISSLIMDSECQMQLMVAGDDEIYTGPDPVVMGYVPYMQFLGMVEAITGLRSFVREYMQDRLR